MEIKRFTLVIFLIAVATAIEVKKYPYELNENDFCGLDTTIYSGKCKKLSACRNLIVAKKTVEVCSFDSVLTGKLADALVCCSREDFYASRRLNGGGILDYEKCKERYRHLRAEGETFQKFVVNGEDVEPYEFSHMAAIGWLTWFDFSVKWNCGGSLITENYVMSAAHCMSFNGIRPNVVRFGDIDLNSPFDDHFVQQFGVQNIIIHPQYDVNGNQNDIALIHLLGTVTATKNVVPACINANQQSPEFIEGAGYGQSGFGQASTNKLLKASLQLIDVPSCQESYSLKISEDSQMCAQGYREDIEEQDLCYGDSGGALQYQNMDTEDGVVYKIPTIVAITSYGIGCAFGVPGVYVNVSHYIDWMESVISP